MKTKTLHEPTGMLPANSATYKRGARHRSDVSLHGNLAGVKQYPQQGWRVALTHHQSGEPLPASLRDPSIRRAYHYLRGYRDEQMAMAEALHFSEDARTTEVILQGLLCAEDISLEGIGTLLELPPAVVELYAALFFNVRRMGAAVCAGLIFPETRLGTVLEAEKEHHELRRNLRRVGRDYGWKEVARLAGLRTIEEDGESPEAMLADLEKTTAATARMLARAGHLNRKESPGIKHAKALLKRAKPEAVTEQTDDDRLGLGSFGLCEAVSEHFRRITDTDTQYRLALQRQQLMQERDVAAPLAGE